MFFYGKVGWDEMPDKHFEGWTAIGVVQPFLLGESRLIVAMKSAEQYFNFMCHLHKRALELAKHFNFDKQHRWHLNLVTLYCSIIELTGSACILVQEKVGIGIPILLRSVVEAHLDFVNLASERTYGYHLRASELNEWIKLLKEAIGGSNPFLKDIAEFSDTPKVLEKYEREKKELLGKGYKALSIYEKFDKAKLEAIYRSVYNILCCDSHNNLRALQSRHINISEEMNDFKVELYPEINYDRLLPYIDNFCGILISATETIHKILETNCANEIEELNSEFQKQRRNIST